MPVKGERDAAIRAVARFAATAAKQRCGKPSPIQKQDCLLTFFQAVGDGGAQFFGQDRGRFLLPALLAMWFPACQEAGV